MAAVVFLRGVNVGGHRPFRPAVLARELSAFDVVNVGAAGTFVVLGPASQVRLRAEFARLIPFETEFMICRARELVDLASEKWPAHEAAGKDTRRFVSVLAKRPTIPFPLPFSQPQGRAWQSEGGEAAREVRVEFVAAHGEIDALSE